MARFKIDIDDFAEDIFEELEKISTGYNGHECEIEAMNHDNAAVILSGKLISFIRDRMEEVYDD